MRYDIIDNHKSSLLTCGRNFSVLDAEDLRLSLDSSGSSSSNVDLSAIPNDISPKDKLVYIYTSGTTGMPKAAVITNLR